MRQFIRHIGWSALAAVVLGFAAGVVQASETGYRQVVDGVAIYFGVLPAELVRGHPPDHPESGMHGGTPVGENHIMVALFEDKTGRRIATAGVTARLTDNRGLDVRKKLEPMVVAGAASYGNYFYMPGTGPYRIQLTIRLPGATREIHTTFAWARS